MSEVKALPSSSPARSPAWSPGSRRRVAKSSGHEVSIRSGILSLYKRCVKKRLSIGSLGEFVLLPPCLQPIAVPLVAVTVDLMGTVEYACRECDRRGCYPQTGELAYRALLEEPGLAASVAGRCAGHTNARSGCTWVKLFNQGGLDAPHNLPLEGGPAAEGPDIRSDLIELTCRARQSGGRRHPPRREALYGHAGPSGPVPFPGRRGGVVWYAPHP